MRRKYEGIETARYHRNVRIKAYTVRYNSRLLKKIEANKREQEKVLLFYLIFTHVQRDIF